MLPRLWRDAPSLLIASALALLFVAPARAFAQQSLFNVPSSTGTTPGDIFVQEQISAGDVVESNTTVDVGIFPWLELGVNALHVDLVSPSGPAQHDDDVIAGNLALHASVLPWLHLQLGAQVGGGIVPAAGDAGFFVFAWATARFSLPAELGEVVVGGYAGDSDALGAVPLGGGLVGVDLTLVRRLLHFVADWVIGEGDLAVAVIGVAVDVGDGWQISTGLQLPSPGTTNTLGLVLELTHGNAPPEARRGEGDSAPR